MNCKFCNGELPEDVTLCPACGKDNAVEESTVTEEIPAVEASVEENPAEEASVEENPAEEASVEENPAEEASAAEAPCEEAPAPKKTGLKIALCVIAVLAILAAIAAAVWYGINGGWTPRPNDVTYSANYTVEDEKIVKQADKVVATAGGVELTNAELQLYYWEAVNMFLSDYYYYLSYIGMDYTQPLAEQTCYFDESLTWEQYFLKYALDSWHRYASVGLLAEQDSFSPDEELQTYLDELPQYMEEMAVAYGYESLEAMLRDSYGAGATVESYLTYAENYYISNEYLGSLYDTFLPTQEEIDTYYAEHEADLTASGITKDMGLLSNVRHILIMPEGGTTDETTGVTTYSEDEWAAAKAEAERILAEWQAGAATEESFMELVTTYSQDTGSVADGGLISDVCADGTYVVNFQNWAIDSSRQAGDTGIVETEYGYHIMYFIEGVDYCSYYLESTIANERMNEMVENALAQYPIDVNYRRIVLGSVDFTS